MRRVPPIVWILTPLALGLLYAAGHALLAPTPTLADLPPKDAILVHRVRGLDMLDLTSPGPRGPALRAPRETLGRERNNVGLVGVDHAAWVHLVLMPRTLRLDSTMAIFRLEDEDAFEREFMRTDFLERGLIRHAQHLRIQGGYAAVGPHRDATRRLGTGGITCVELGEDWAMAARVPELVDHAAHLAKHYPWRELLTALGIDVEAARLRFDPASQRILGFLPGDRRLQHVRDGWRTARLWAWHTGKRLRVELEPTEGSPVAVALAALPAETAGRPPAPPPAAQAWLSIPGAPQRAALARILLAAGVRFVPGGAAEPADPLGGLGRPGTAGILLWGERGVGTGYALTIGMAAASGSLPDLGSFLPVPPGRAWSSAPLPAGAAPITVGDTTVPRKVPPGTLERRDVAGTEIVAFGPSGKAAAEGMVAFLATQPAPRAAPSDLPQGWRVLATFFLNQRRADRVLGRALQPGGFLAMLSGGDVHGVVLTDGRLVRLEARVER